MFPVPAQSITFFPEGASTHAAEVDLLYFFLLAVTAFFVILIAGLIGYFGFRYRRRSADYIPPRTEAHMGLEVVWAVIPLGIVLVIFFWGAGLFFSAARIPEDTLDVYVVGRQWMWEFQHAQGRREINELHVPLGRPIKLILSSQDVIHSFYVPAFRLKQDLLPGRYTTAWFEANKPGTYHLFCAEYCGTLHSSMIGSVIVMEPGDFELWLAGAVVGETPAQSGEKLFNRLGCLGCHGSRAPTLAGLYGSTVRLQTGQTVVADEDYLRESILDPSAKLVAGYQPLMPTFSGLLTEQQLMQLLSYIKSLQKERVPGGTP